MHPQSGPPAPDLQQAPAELPVSSSSGPATSSPPQSAAASGSTLRSRWRTRSFLRTAREVTLIVASILIAFTLDRWWDSARERADERDYAEALHREFAANRATLQATLADLNAIDAALSRLLALTGPEPALIPPDSLASLFDHSFRFSVVELPSGSLQALLASGDLAIIADGDLRAALASWPALVARARADAELLVENREELIRHLDGLMPTLAIARSDNSPGGGTRFPIDVRSVLSNLRVEGLLGNREVRLYNVVQDHRALAAAADSILVMLERRGAGALRRTAPG